MSHLNAPATKLLGVQCLICATPLLDAESVELGIGPVCRKKWYDKGIDPTARAAANKLVAEATVCKAAGEIARVIEIAEELQTLGLRRLAGRVRSRFIHLQLVTAEREGVKWVSLFTPYRKLFPYDLRLLIPDTQKTRVDNDQEKFDHWDIHPDGKRALFLCLSRHFAGDRCYVDNGNDDTKTIVIPSIREFQKTYVDAPEAAGKLHSTAAELFRARCRSWGA